MPAPAIGAILRGLLGATASRGAAGAATSRSAGATVDAWIEAWRSGRGKRSLNDDLRGVNQAQGMEQNSDRKNRENEKGATAAEEWTSKLQTGAAAMGVFAGRVTGAAVAIVGAAEGLSLLNTGVLALNRDLAAFNGQIATAYARFEADEIRRKTRRARALDDPIAELSDAQSDFKDAIQEIKIPVERVLLTLLGKATEATTHLLKITTQGTDLYRVIEFISNHLGERGDGDSTAWRQFFADTSDGKFDGIRPTFDGKREQILKGRDHDEVFGR